MIDVPGGTVVAPDAAPRKGGRLGASSRSLWPMRRSDSGEEVRLDLFPPFETGSDEDFHVEGLSEGWAALRNPRLGAGIALRWDVEVFPYVWCWIVAEGSWGYPYYGRLVYVALEPFTSPIGNLVKNDALGTAPHLGPGETVETSLLAVPFTGAGRVSGFDGDAPRLVPD
jgi:hypothetical protein